MFLKKWGQWLNLTSYFFFLKFIYFCCYRFTSKQIFLSFWLIMLDFVFGTSNILVQMFVHIEKIFFKVVCLHCLPNTIVSNWDAKFMRYFSKNLWRILNTKLKFSSSRQLIECWVKKKKKAYHGVNVSKKQFIMNN